MIDDPEPLPSIATFQRPWRIRFVDTDATGFAHLSSYLRMMEETEYAFLRRKGLSVVFYDKRGTLGFPRIHVEVSVIRPLVFDQVVVVHLSLTELDGKRLVFEFNIVDEQQETAVTGNFIVACCRFPDQEPPFAVLIPPDVEQALVG